MLKRVMVTLIILSFVVVPITLTSNVYAVEEKHPVKKVDEETNKPIKGAHFKIEARKPINKSNVPVTGSAMLVYGVSILIAGGVLVVPYVIRIRKVSKD